MVLEEAMEEHTESNHLGRKPQRLSCLRVVVIGASQFVL